ncbi:MAG: hypothetical protein JXB35_16340 [Anaerolineae bacterium]|nr:hypothetical protein [Anaerolineae bacterium]
MKWWGWLGVGMLAGLLLGLLLGWVVWPIQYYDTAPAQLRADYRDQYIALIAATYEVEGDLNAARSRLAALGTTPATESLVVLIEHAMAAQAETIALRPLIRLARDLGVATDTMQLYLDTEEP